MLKALDGSRICSHGQQYCPTVSQLDLNAKAKKKALMCEWESRFVSDRRRKCPKLFMLVLKNRGWVGWRLEKILKMSEGSYVNFSYSKNYVQYLETKQENMERKCNRGSREMECVDINRKHLTNCLLF